MQHAKHVTMSNPSRIEIAGIEAKIYLIRGEKVILDYDLAELYQGPTKRLKEQVKRNQSRFPSDFMFKLTVNEGDSLKSQFATSKPRRGGNRVLPVAFTEHGIAMLSSVLNSERAIEVNIAVIRSFIRLRQVLNSNQGLGSKEG